MLQIVEGTISECRRHDEALDVSSATGREQTRLIAAADLMVSLQNHGMAAALVGNAMSLPNKVDIRYWTFVLDGRPFRATFDPAPALARKVRVISRLRADGGWDASAVHLPSAHCVLVNSRNAQGIGVELLSMLRTMLAFSALPTAVVLAFMILPEPANVMSWLPASAGFLIIALLVSIILTLLACRREWGDFRLNTEVLRVLGFKNPSFTSLDKGMVAWFRVRGRSRPELDGCYFNDQL